MGSHRQTSDFVDVCVIVKLRLQRLKPNRDLNIAAGTLLAISYGVSYVGVFKAFQTDAQMHRPGRFSYKLFQSKGNRLPRSEAPATQSNLLLSLDPHRKNFHLTFLAR